MMENVPGLGEDTRLKLLLSRLEKAGYALRHGVIDAVEFNVPQRRRRFVLLGVREGDLGEDAPVAGPRATVRLAIGGLPRPEESEDSLHNHGEKRSRRIRELIRSIPADGHGLRTMGKENQLECHVRMNGFYDVYGRMAWDKPAPTITSGCINPSKGRFLHPEQHRAITLREAALLQDLPPTYDISMARGKYQAAELIGNALPAGFAEWQARTLAASLI
jgi:DNA (cytosine-5)-methyltransferase 1